MRPYLRKASAAMVGSVVGAVVLAAASAGPAMASPSSPPSPPLSPPSGEAGDAAIAQIRADAPGNRELARLDPTERLRRMTRCTDLDGETYCLHLGFTSADTDSAEWAERIADLAYVESSETGAARVADTAAALARLDQAERDRAEAAQVRAASRAVGKVKALRHLLRDEAVPEELADRYPGQFPKAWTLSTQTGGGGARVAATSRATIMDGHYEEQWRSDYCGPAVMQMIDWADDGTRNSQHTMARWVGWVDDGGTSITGLVRAVNKYTSWPELAGKYIVFDVRELSAKQFFKLHKRRSTGHMAPIIEHVRLRNEYFSYLRYDHGGHFQVGRGYDESDGTIAVFEPYDERDWSRGGNHTGKPQWVPYTLQLRATTEKYFGNIGL